MNHIRTITIGVLAMQGAYCKHIESVTRLGVRAIEVRNKEELNAIDGLIIPGGESTTIEKLLEKNSLTVPLKKRISEGMAVFGTCAGMIILAKSIQGREQSILGIMDISVERNAYGRQIDSFESGLTVKEICGGPVKGIFIRAPKIVNVDENVEVLASHDGVPVLVRQGKILAASFHPELTDDLRIHSLFVSMNV